MLHDLCDTHQCEPISSSGMQLAYRDEECEPAQTVHKQAEGRPYPMGVGRPHLPPLRLRSPEKRKDRHQVRIKRQRMPQPRRPKKHVPPPAT